VAKIDKNLGEQVPQHDVTHKYLRLFANKKNFSNKIRFLTLIKKNRISVLSTPLFYIDTFNFSDF
jgi:hypothetical protein